MKKLIAILTALCLMCSAAAFAEQASAFTVKEGVTFGMNQNDLIAALNGARYETDTEHTHGAGIIFTEVEVEDQNVFGVRADVHYLFFNGKLAAIHVDCDDGSNAYSQLKAKGTEAYGESAPVDMAKLGNGIYAADDDGRFEGQTECWIDGNVMIILEKEADGDTDVHMIDLTAEFI